MDSNEQLREEIIKQMGEEGKRIRIWMCAGGIVRGEEDVEENKEKEEWINPPWTPF